MGAGWRRFSEQVCFPHSSLARVILGQASRDSRLPRALSSVSYISPLLPIRGPNPVTYWTYWIHG